MKLYRKTVLSLTPWLQYSNREMSDNQNCMTDTKITIVQQFFQSSQYNCTFDKDVKLFWQNASCGFCDEKQPIPNM